MNKKPEFDTEGYQKNLIAIGDDALPAGETRRLTQTEAQQLGIPSPQAILDHLRSNPSRGTPSRTETALAARKALRLSQRDFAKLIGSSPSAVRNWEQGRTRVPKMARKLMHVVERHPDILKDLAEMDSEK